MLEPLKHVLSSHRIILASGSPRRKEILSNSGLGGKFEIIPSTAEENLDRTLAAYKENPWKFAEDTAQLKADEVFQRLTKENGTTESPLLVIGSDTVVTYKNEIYGKPKGAEDAKRMLETFSGNRHKVYTGVCLIRSSSSSSPESRRLFHCGTSVQFDSLCPEVISSYIASGEPMDKAGAYGIQALGGTLVKEIEGDYFNVMGFPLNKFCRELMEMFAPIQN